jgi:hypothetical protein
MKDFLKACKLSLGCLGFYFWCVLIALPIFGLNNFGNYGIVMFVLCALMFPLQVLNRLKYGD